MNDRLLAGIARWGAALAFVVVAASALLRLGTSIDAGGNATSTLAPALESFARIAHRIAASAVGLLAVAALIVALRERPVPCARRAPLVAIVAFTLVLAAIGRYTPGYRFLGVTVANAVLGVALACAFALLQTGTRRTRRNTEGTEKGEERRRKWLPTQESRGAIPLVRMLVLAAVLVEIGLGTAASAAAMHGRFAFEPLHVALGPVVAGLVAWIALRERGWIAALAVMQMALGMALAAMGAARGIPGEWLHAMLACALAVALTACAARPSRI